MLFSQYVFVILCLLILILNLVQLYPKSKHEEQKIYDKLVPGSLKTCT